MKKSVQINRRSYLVSQLAIASLAGGASAMALSGPGDMTSETSLLKAGGDAVWKRGTADDFKGLINESFTAFAKDGSMFHLVLDQVESGHSGPARPNSLVRSESVSLMFKSVVSPDLLNIQEQSVTMWNSKLGEFELFLSPVPRRSGGFDLEVILN